MRRTVGIEEVVQYGEPPLEPEVSIIVPLYGRIDLIEHQIAQFVHDPELHAADLIYVLDSPELATDWPALGGQLCTTSTASRSGRRLNRNAGYRDREQPRAPRARGRLLLLLNSDVLPPTRRAGSGDAAFHDATADIGALGPKLLYEDESIQHAGMYFQFDHRRACGRTSTTSRGSAARLRAPTSAAACRPSRAPA